MKRRAGMSESALQEHVVKLLQAYGRTDIIWFHPANGESRSKKTGARLKRMGVRAGVSDLIILRDGAPLALELKTEIGRLSREQVQFREDWTRAGGVFQVIFGFDHAVSVLTECNILRSNIKLTTTPTAAGCAGGARGASAPPSLSSEPKARRRPRLSAHP